MGLPPGKEPTPEEVIKSFRMHEQPSNDCGREASGTGIQAKAPIAKKPHPIFEQPYVKARYNIYAQPCFVREITSSMAWKFDESG